MDRETAPFERHPTTHIVGPAAWSSYLINGDSSGLTADEKQRADAWQLREQVAIVGTEPDAEPWFTWSARVHAPELDCDGALMLDYRAVELSIGKHDA